MSTDVVWLVGLAGQVGSLEGMELDPDDPRPPYIQVATALRASILNRKFAPGEQLPSQNELAKTFGVARMTVQQALRILRDDGLTVSRQGSGVYVRERTARPVGLRPYVERAFDADDVRIDFVGYTSETLHGAITEPLDKIRSGRLTPQSVRLRILLPDMSRPVALPAATSGDEADDARARHRLATISARHLDAIRATVEELQELGFVPTATVENRVHGSAPQFKAYILNDEDVFFGYYPVQEHKMHDDSGDLTIYDSAGKDAELFHHSADGDSDSISTQFVTQTRHWFDSVWTTIAKATT